MTGLEPDSGKLELFLTHMQRIWIGRSLTPTNSLISSWRALGECFRDADNGQASTNSIRFQLAPLHAGCGKSTAALLWAVLNADTHNYLLVVRTIDECKAIIEQASVLQQDLKLYSPTVRTFNSQSPRAKALEADVLIVCNAQLQRLPLEPGRSTLLFHRGPDQTAKFHGGSRVCIIDESFSWGYPFCVPLSLVAKTSKFFFEASSFICEQAGNIQLSVDQVKAECSWLTDLVNRIESTVVTANQSAILSPQKLVPLDALQDAKSPVASLRILSRQQEVMKLALAHNPFSDRAITNELKATRLLVKCLAVTASDRLVATRDKLGVRAERFFPADLESASATTVLDATGEIELGFRLLPRSVAKLATLPVPRSFNFVRVEPLIAARTGKSLLETFPHDLPVLVQRISETTPTGSQVLVLTHKAIRDEVESSFRNASQDFIWRVGHFGRDERGTNEYRSCEAVIILGLQHRPDSYYISQLLALSDSPDELGEDQPRKERVADARTHDQLAAIVQGILRSRARQPSASNDRPLHALLTLGPSRHHRLLLSSLGPFLPGATVLDSSKLPSAGTCSSRGRRLRERFLLAISDSPVEPQEHPISEILAIAGISKNGWSSSLRPQLQDRDSPLAQELRALGWEVVHGKRGRGHSSRLRRVLDGSGK